MRWCLFIKQLWLVKVTVFDQLNSYDQPSQYIERGGYYGEIYRRRNQKS